MREFKIGCFPFMRKNVPIILALRSIFADPYYVLKAISIWFYVSRIRLVIFSWNRKKLEYLIRHVTDACDQAYSKEMASSSVASLSVIVKRSQQIVKDRTILKCSWEDTIGTLLLRWGNDLEAETILWSGHFKQWQIRWSTTQSSSWCSCHSVWPVPLHVCLP